MSLKRFIRRYWYMIIAALIIICGLIAVAVPAIAKTQAEGKETNRFTLVEKIGNIDFGGYDLFIVQDAETGCKYLYSAGGGICPLIETNTTVAPITATKQEIDIPIDDYKDAAKYLAKTVYGEARGCSTTEQAAVIWCILNRVDNNGGYSPKSIINVVTAKKQFHGYIPSNPVTDEHYNLAIDVLSRWLREKNGETDVGRVLPAEFIYFSGDGKRNHYRTDWKGGTNWDWSLESPYEV